MSSVLSLFFVV